MRATEVIRGAVAGTLALAAGAPAVVQADVIEITNPLAWAATLSDLIVWDASGKQEVILKPGTDPAAMADNVKLGHQESRIYVTELKVAKYFVSTLSGTLGEYEWKHGPRVDITTTTAMLTDTATGAALHTAVTDLLGAAVTVEPGTIAHFQDGLSPEYPGWFVGTTADFVLGEITGGFTGSAVFEPGQLSVRVIPAPAALALLGLALALGRRR